MADFTEQMAAGRPLAGVFVKTPAGAIVEIAGLNGLDFCVLDAEHAPIDLRAVDALIPCARSVSLPCLVRTPDHAPAFLSACLDLGADGVLVPRVGSAEQARAIVAAARFADGGRGFSPSPRAFGYGRAGGAEGRAAADRAVSVWLQIEDEAGLGAVDAIAAVPGVGCLFIGPADLALSLGEDALDAATQTIAAAGRRAGVRVGAFAAGAEDMAAFAALGVTLFVGGSDQGLYAAGVRDLAERVRAFAPNPRTPA